MKPMTVRHLRKRHAQQASQLAHLQTKVWKLELSNERLRKDLESARSANRRLFLRLHPV